MAASKFLFRELPLNLAFNIVRRYTAIEDWRQRDQLALTGGPS